MRCKKWFDLRHGRNKIRRKVSEGNLPYNDEQLDPVSYDSVAFVGLVANTGIVSDRHPAIRSDRL